MNEFVVELPIGLVAHGKIQPGLFVHNAFCVGKGEETGFSVVRAHAALAETAEAHFAGGQMDDCVVDAAAAETAMGGHKAGGLFVTGEKVEGQGMSHGIDFGDSTLQGIQVSTGRTGPKISSCMTGSEKVTLSMTVGAIFSFSGRVEPPQTVLAGSMSFRIR